MPMECLSWSPSAKPLLLNPQPFIYGLTPSQQTCKGLCKKAFHIPKLTNTAAVESLFAEMIFLS